MNSIAIDRLPRCEICDGLEHTWGNYVHCKKCKALIDKVHCVSGLGVTCGCLGKEFRKMKSELKGA